MSLSQATEYGTVYTRSEIEVIAEYVHAHGLKLHMDGARLANAAAHLGVSLREISGDAGVDVLSFGGTKNGLIAGEALVFSIPLWLSTSPIAACRECSSLQRCVSSPRSSTLFTDELWRRSAAHANGMAALLGRGLSEIAGITITQKIQANEVFAMIPREHVARLQGESYFHIWNEGRSEARFVASFDTTEEEVRKFVAAARAILSSESELRPRRVQDEVRGA